MPHEVVFDEVIVNGFAEEIIADFRQQFLWRSATFWGIVKDSVFVEIVEVFWLD
ncbi:hypothetical protein D3C86_1950460 [compost metagenome]